MRAALAKYLPPLTKEFTWKQTYILDGALEKVEKNLTIPQSAFDWLVNDVCKTCNEGWLNHNVEMPAEGILALAMQGRPMRAMEADTRSLALWASKTSAVRALMDPLPRAIPPAHYAHIKDRLEPAPNTLIWLAHTEFCSTPFMRHTRLGTVGAGGQRDTTSHFTSIVYGHMALFIVGASDQRGLWIYERTADAISALDTLQIWPTMETPVWPINTIPLATIRQLTSFLPPHSDLFEAGFLRNIDE